jgi:hypothetical protein
MQQFIMYYYDIIICSEPGVPLSMSILTKVDLLLEMFIKDRHLDKGLILLWLQRLLNKISLEGNYNLYIPCVDKIKKFLTI